MMPHLDGLAFLEKGVEFLLKPIVAEALFEKIQPLRRLTPDQLVDKKLFPMNLNFVSKSVTEIEMKLEGIPWRKDKGQIFESFTHFLAGRSTFTDLKIIIDRDFFFDGRALHILDDFLASVAKKTKIRTKNIYIQSAFLRSMHGHLKEYECLRDVFII